MAWLAGRRQAHWTRDAAEYRRWNELIGNLRGSREGAGMALAQDELLYASEQKASLIEVRREPGRWESSSSGVSIPVPVFGRVYSGQGQSRYIPGEAKPTELDGDGTVYVTNKRIAFAGNKSAREWRFDDILRAAPGPGAKSSQKAMYIAVSKRQKVSAFGYRRHGSEEFEFLCGLALARHQGTVDDFRLDLLIAATEHYEKAPGAVRKRLSSTDWPRSW